MCVNEELAFEVTCIVPALAMFLFDSDEDILTDLLVTLPLAMPPVTLSVNQSSPTKHVYIEKLYEQLSLCLNSSIELFQFISTGCALYSAKCKAIVSLKSTHFHMQTEECFNRKCSNWWWRRNVTTCRFWCFLIAWEGHANRGGKNFKTKTFREKKTGRRGITIAKRCVQIEMIVWGFKKFLNASEHRDLHFKTAFLCPCISIWPQTQFLLWWLTELTLCYTGFSGDREAVVY